MSCSPGKIQILGVNDLPNHTGITKVITFRFTQGRNPEWVSKPFFAEYDENALWLGDLKPAFGEKKFFFEKQLKQTYHEKISDSLIMDFE